MNDDRILGFFFILLVIVIFLVKYILPLAGGITGLVLAGKHNKKWLFLSVPCFCFLAFNLICLVINLCS